MGHFQPSLLSAPAVRDLGPAPAALGAPTASTHSRTVGHLWPGNEAPSSSRRKTRPTAHPDALDGNVRRRRLAPGAWIDCVEGWMSGADDLFEWLADEVPWRTERRTMFAREVDVPRLVYTFSGAATLPFAPLVKARAELSRYYANELGEPFVSTSLCLYRDGSDSVAWHGDRIGRGRHADTMVAILVLGNTRKLQLRPRAGGSPLTLTPAHGDLVVMGGSCQRTWEHAVPKTRRPSGPRISVQFRPRNVF